MQTRTKTPDWVRYAEYIGDGSDKYYEVRVDLDDNNMFQVTARWGRRPDNGGGQQKVYDYVPSMGSATSHAIALFSSKIAKGYREVDRPDVADSQVAQDYDQEYD